MVSLSSSLLLAVQFCLLATAIPAIDRDAEPRIGDGEKRLSFKQTTPWPSGDLYPRRHQYNWAKGGNTSDSTIFGKDEAGNFILRDVVSNKTTLLNGSKDFPNPDGYTLNSDQSKILLAVNKTSGFRYSFKANYVVLDLKTNQTTPLFREQRGDVQAAVWNPRKPNILTFVWGNNVYFWDNGNITQVTKDGSESVFNGIGDWVYEEEILETPHALYWSPDGQVLGFISFNDREVYNYTVPYYMCKEKNPPSYPCDVTLRYPKPGYPNPKVTIKTVYYKDPGYISELASPSKFENLRPPEESVFGEFVWLTDAHEKYMVRSFNRIQNQDFHTIHHIRGGSPTGGQEHIMQMRDRKAKDGWFDNDKTIHWAGYMNDTDWYLQVDDEDGWNHIYLFPSTSKYINGQFQKLDSKQLTSGHWEVRKIQGVDVKKGIVYFTSSEVHPTESHPYSLNYKTGEKKALVGTKSGYWDIKVSPRAQYALLSNHGPGVPYQELYSLNDTSQPIRIVEDNAALAKRLQEFALPKVEFLDLQHPAGYNLSAKIIYPAGFDKSKKYPVLMNPYGGPTSQEVKKEFVAPGFHSYIASDPDLEYAIFVVDNRGTGQRGRAFRQTYYKRMGDVDVVDQLWSAHWLADKYPWVDREKIGIWGWSNGGYLSAKVVERGDPIISWAIATAPTSDQRLYDSIYSERYLGNPDYDPEVYDRVAIRNATGFKNLRGSILFQHGTGDDNVHFQHSVALVDMLMQSGVNPSKVQVQYFPDSEHSIHYGRDSEFLYKQITAKLYMEKHRVVSEKKHQWETDDGESIQYWFQEDNNRRNILLTSPTVHEKWRMMQGEEAIAT